ncbi:MFS transporter [Novosphingobium piscinae]|uniref:MFS transporter n=1 Tax=Novosphingobium piscinae TaxID=1507448 RepID=A0A7X1KNL1_9SPHN|nr:MFS transporter [Novosphingobium piscinae]MBC2667752.1 MFS transporter [Novosphingobium piscinae]
MRRAEDVTQPPDASPPADRATSLLAPLANPTYRNIWMASFVANFGQLIQGVGAAWEMTRLTGSPEMVALVQTAMFLPSMLLSLVSGAIADVFDRRKVALLGYAIAMAAAAAMASISYAGWLTPWVLLGFCFAIGCGSALFAPSWQASVSEQVEPRHLPSAIALGTISYNAARSIGPALGGAVVAAFGAMAAFVANALCYLPSMLAFYLWKRPQVPSRFEPERIDRAVIGGVRYSLHSPQIRIVIVRAFIAVLGSSAVTALTPLIAKDLLGGNAATYGLLLGIFGVGAVIGASFVGQIRARFDMETAVRFCALAAGTGTAIAGLSRSLPLTALGLLLAGGPSMIMLALFNVNVQLSAPRWVTGRALSFYNTATTAGISVGAWLWGVAAHGLGTGPALVVSGACLAATVLLGRIMPIPTVAGPLLPSQLERADPETSLAITPRSGPIVIEIDYLVREEHARAFYAVMQELRGARTRSGAFDWSLARDLQDPRLWTERYHCPTWADYMRQRNRLSAADEELQHQANSFYDHQPADRVRRRLERPYGSVRSSADAPDRGDSYGPISF